MRYDIRRLFGTADGYSDAGSPLRRRLRLLTPSERLEEARAFLDLYCRENGQTKAHFQRRWSEIRAELSASGYYRHTPEELGFGARIAWRNHGRCIGRLFWESLEVFDCRHLTEPPDIAARMIDHMRDALGDGRIRAMISVFAPVEANRLPAHVESAQITQYAGYRLPDGQVVGDRQNVEATRVALSLGWTPPSEPGMFDMLPFAIRDREDRRSIHSLPPDTWREVTIVHPTHCAVGDLGLRWYAVPCVSNMILTIGGIDYPCAPFNGFYMATEIASRDLADYKRYDLLPKIAGAIGVAPNDAVDPFWRDAALTELNRSVLHSFRSAGVTIIDHHAASSQFMDFHRREQSAGRRVAADWRWIVPPQASSMTDVFHLRMRNFHPVPNYYSGRATDGWRLMPFYGDRYRSRLSMDLDRVRRRWKLWKRMPW
ncbi:nitric oxide synthase oxygenase [Hoeflea sp.]|uniref:nitric oxide synthase oxygenase n=1 Tax=Hoeflea sp. TaxID=1940281 RepID=UPI0019A8FCA2|nr:nitric oxide synthase oxygenase [Hoeflea sp.]MBC7286190.1 nitric oxide synthase oxygenase [Hoeflea sp.]